MPRRINKVSWVIATVAIQMLRPWVVCIACIRILAKEPTCLRVIEPCVHILQPGACVGYAACICYLIEEVAGACLRQVAILVICVLFNRVALRVNYSRHTTSYIVVIEEVRVCPLIRGSRVNIVVTLFCSLQCCTPFANRTICPPIFIDCTDYYILPNKA